MASRVGNLGGAGYKSAGEAHLYAQLAELAERQHLVLALAQLEALGMSRFRVAAWARQHRLHRVHQAVYALVPVSQLTVHGRYLAAVLACRPAGARAAALSHRSAADLHGLRASHRRTTDVIVPGRSAHRHPGIELHRSLGLDPARDLTAVNGIPTTTVARTLLDLAAVVARRPLERALDQAEQLRVFDLRALTDQLRRNPDHPAQGRLAATLSEHSAGETVTDSELEERMYALVDRAGLPRPRFHGPIDTGDGVLLRPDFVWRAVGLAVEVDGAKAHMTRHAFEEDRRRDQRLIAAGWRVVRITWRQLDEEPARIAALLADLLGAGRPDLTVGRGRGVST